MWIVHWELSCINSSVEQTFNLVFENTKPLITPDGTFQDVPLGVDPTQWPLDIDVKKTVEAAAQNPLYPGGTFSVYGNFCWGGEKARAEAYFVPAGTKPNGAAQSRDPRVALQVMQQLQAEHMLGTAVTTGDGYVTFNVPDDEKVLEGSGENTVARLVVYDNKAHRASAIDEKNVLSLKATKKPLSWPLIAGIAGLAIVIVLLIMVLVRGSGPKRRGGGPPPSPTPGYGAPPGPYGAPPAGGGAGGYGLQQQAAEPAMAGPAALAQPLFAPQPQAPQPDAIAPSHEPSYAGANAAPVVQLRCPACGMNTMATPGQPSVCFSCGQPLPADLTKGGGGLAGPGFPPTGALNASPLVPPPSPYGAPPAGPPADVSAATLRGASGQYTVPLGGEVRVGRDPAQCAIFLAEPRVSGVHASLKLGGGYLVVPAQRDLEQQHVHRRRAHRARPGRRSRPGRRCGSVRSSSRSRWGPEPPPAVTSRCRPRPRSRRSTTRTAPTPDASRTSRSTRMSACTARRGSAISAWCATAWAATRRGGRPRSWRRRRSRRCLTPRPSRRRRRACCSRRSRRRAAGSTRCAPARSPWVAPARRPSRCSLHAQGTEVAHVGDSPAYLVRAEPRS